MNIYNHEIRYIHCLKVSKHCFCTDIFSLGFFSGFISYCFVLFVVFFFNYSNTSLYESSSGFMVVPVRVVRKWAGEVLLSISENVTHSLTRFCFYLKSVSHVILGFLYRQVNIFLQPLILCRKTDGCFCAESIT